MILLIFTIYIVIIIYHILYKNFVFKIKGHVRLGFKKIGIKGQGIAEMTRG